MNERILTTLLSKYLKLHPPKDTTTYEIKYIKGNSFRFSSVQPHQIQGLLASLEGLGHKISDSPIYTGSKNRFTFKKPFDYVFIKAKNAFITPIFYKERKYKKVFLIPIKEFVKFKGKSIKITVLEEMKFETFLL